MECCLRSNLVSPLDFLHVPTFDYLFEDALIQEILNIVLRYLGITQRDSCTILNPFTLIKV